MTDPVAPALTPEQHALVRLALPAVERRALQVQKMARGRLAVGDLRSIGKLALYAAVLRYDASLGPFQSFASHRVYGEMLNALTLEARSTRVERAARAAAAHHLAYCRDDYDILHDKDEALWEKLHRSSDQLLLAMFVSAVEEADRDAPAERGEYLRAVEALRAAVAKLDADQQMLLAMLYNERLPPSEVAEKLGVALKTVQRRSKALLLRLRELLAKEGVTAAPPVVDV